MKMKTTLLLMLTLLVMSCTENQRAKKFGGTQDIEIPKDEKFVNVTWKNDELWYVSRKAREGEPREVYEFKEKSSYGVIEGVVRFVEQ